uniref:Uncharacterized protein n=1 Tax=Sphaerodactylus townsendi TaxID=933632 RepID=A0ACB8G0I1_9SAUR
MGLILSAPWLIPQEEEEEEEDGRKTGWLPLPLLSGRLRTEAQGDVSRLFVATFILASCFPGGKGKEASAAETRSREIPSKQKKIWLCPGPVYTEWEKEQEGSTCSSEIRSAWKPGDGYALPLEDMLCPVPLMPTQLKVSHEVYKTHSKKGHHFGQLSGDFRKLMVSWLASRVIFEDYLHKEIPHLQPHGPVRWTSKDFPMARKCRKKKNCFNAGFPFRIKKVAE